MLPVHLNSPLSFLVPAINVPIILQFGIHKQEYVNNVQDKSVITINKLNNVLLVQLINPITIIFRKHVESVLSMNLSLINSLDTVKDVNMKNHI